MVISLSSPYLLREFENVPCYLTSYNYTPLSLKALGRVLAGQIAPSGRLPVSIPGLFQASNSAA